MLLAALLAGAAASGCAAIHMRGSGTLATEERRVSGFDAVEMSGTLDVRFTRAGVRGDSGWNAGVRRRRIGEVTLTPTEALWN